MTTSGSIEQKVRQRDNDVHAIYGMLTEISITQGRHTNRLQEITEDMADHTQRLERLEGKVGGLEGKLDGLDGKVDGLDGKLDRVLDLLQG